jgi:ribosome-associated protein
VTSTNAHQFAIELARIAHDNKSEDVVVLDMRGISSVTDYTVIGTGTSDRQIRAVADVVTVYAKTVGQIACGYCGRENSTWIVVDYFDVVFHIFAKKYREYYDLELLWGDAPRLSWTPNESA